jgi:hypothetical protein
MKGQKTEKTVLTEGRKNKMREEERKGRKKRGLNIKYQNLGLVGLASNFGTQDSEASLGSMVRAYLKKEKRTGQK